MVSGLDVTMATNHATESTRTSQAPAGANAPVVISVERLHKSFRIPVHRVDSLKERVVRPFSARDYRELHALDDISFEIRQGEFFGIVGRNGSGKSTLLKILASIYRADSGRIQMAGRLAPFIELGVGFNTELSARENVVLNGVMMGLTPQETRARLDSVIEFAELQEFVDLKLKNYSSGMLVRLAFSLMLEVDADILLIDEVLAVGDAAFQQKCADAFREMKAAGKTIVLVTHAMTTVEEYCHRAMLVSDGRIDYIGAPAEVGRRYLRLNFERTNIAGEASADDMEAGEEVSLVDAYLENEVGERALAVEHGERITLQLELQANIEMEGLDIGFLITNADGVSIFHFGVPVAAEGERRIGAGERRRVRTTLGNPLAPGHYFVSCGFNRADIGGTVLYVENAVDFVVYGGPGGRGVVLLPHESETMIEPSGGTP
jgi:ABC-type polysaccharide/polyol phosphate transport system ATPase subunit